MNVFRNQFTAAAIVAVLLLIHSSNVWGAIPIPSDKAQIISLDGVWRFKLEQSDPLPAKMNALTPLHKIRDVADPEPFQRLDYKEDATWHDLSVPGNWEMAGYSPATYNDPDNAVGIYRLWFDVPAAWKGQRIGLNFDGVQNGAEIYFNGQPVNVDEPAWGRPNYHEGGWDAFGVDLTPAVQFGQTNLLAIRVTKNTRSVDLDTGDYFLLGGIHRSVTLFAVPRTYLEDVTVRTRLLEGGKAEVRVLVAVGGGATDSGGKVSVQLEDLPAVDAQPDAYGDAELSIVVDHPRLWSAEHPNLYSLSVDLHDARGKPTEHFAKRIGIREISIKDGVLLVNNVPVKLAGMCRHDVYPTLGTALTPEMWRKDIQLLKAANVNAVRTSHYPDGSGFYDLCDELGIYVLDEMAACWVNTNSDELTPAFSQHARELVERDKNHPSVIIWGIGNENRLGKNNEVAADEIRRLDPTRPRLVSCRSADEYGVEFDDRHYPEMPVIDKDLIDPRRQTIPEIYTENPNIWEVRNGADVGALDLWGAVLDREWKKFWPNNHFAGSFLWEWTDRAVADQCPTKFYDYDPATGINVVKIKGLVDGFRNPRPDYYHVKVVYAPIKVDRAPQVSGSVVSVHAINYYSFTDLSELVTTWHLLKSGQQLASGVSHPALAPLAHGDLKFDLPPDPLAKADALRIDFNHADGANIVTYEIRLVPGPPAVICLDAGNLNRVPFPHLNLITVTWGVNHDGWHWAFRHPARLVNISVAPTGKPAADSTSISDTELYSTPLSRLRSVTADIVLTDDPKNAVAGHVRTNLVDGRFSYQIDWTGAPADIQELGWAFELPKSLDHFSWHRDAYWSYYPQDHIGRITGTSTPDSADVHITRFTRPDAFDFNSTKYHCDWASLTDAAGKGLGVQFTPEDRHQCKGGFSNDGGYTLIVNKECCPPRDLSSAIVADLYLKMKRGDQREGSFTVGWLGHQDAGK